MRSFTWRAFGMFVAAPALLLAGLGLRAVRAERLEGEQRLRDQQSHVAQLADAAIANVLTMRARQLQGGDSVSELHLDPSIGTPVAFTASGLVTFRRDKSVLRSVRVASNGTCDACDVVVQRVGRH